MEAGQALQSHENVVALLDVFAEGSALVIVWELIEGPDLLDLLNENRGRLSEPQAAEVFAQVGSGLATGWEKKPRHRLPPSAGADRHCFPAR